MKILVTAFGPFDGRVENASSLALHALRKTIPGIRTRILPVDSVVAPARLKHALRLIRPDVIILLGEAAGGKTIRLESTAWNELDFKIPDIVGRQPTARAIAPDSPPFHRATLPLAKIQVSLETNGHQVSLSHDPGRYLCNQVFFTALDWLHTHALPCRAGFIHLPLAEHYPTDRAANALALALRVLLSNC